MFYYSICNHITINMFYYYICNHITINNGKMLVIIIFFHVINFQDMLLPVLPKLLIHSQILHVSSCTFEQLPCHDLYHLVYWHTSPKNNKISKLYKQRRIRMYLGQKTEMFTMKYQRILLKMYELWVLDKKVISTPPFF